MTDLASAFSPDHPLVLAGVGKMGGALLAGWLERGLTAASVRVVDPTPPDDSRALLSLAGIKAEPESPRGTTARVLVVAVKPQGIDAVLATLKPLIGRDTAVVSIAAGTTLARLDAGLGPAAIVRTMPNTPAQIGRGITAAVANAAVGPAGKALVTELLLAAGEVVWLDDEALIDAVTAVSGSGPAYVFLLAECLAEAGVEAGLPRAVAEQLARATVSGAGELLHRSDLPAAQLRKNVTSPNGTTAAALEVLMAKDGLQPLLTKAIAAAARRSRKLAG